VDNEIEFRDRLVNVVEKPVNSTRCSIRADWGVAGLPARIFFPKESGSDNDKARVWKLLVHPCRGLQKHVAALSKENPANKADAEPSESRGRLGARANEVRPSVDHNGSPDKFGAGRIASLRTLPGAAECEGWQQIRNYVGWNLRDTRIGKPAQRIQEGSHPQFGRETCHTTGRSDSARRFSDEVGFKRVGVNQILSCAGE